MDDKAALDAQTRLGDAVRRMRGRSGMSQEQLAEASGLHRTYVSQVERGQRNPTLGTLVRLAGSLDSTVAFILEEAGL